MKYLVNYKETFSRNIIVEADTKVEAEEKLRKSFYDGDIMLTDQDYEYDSGIAMALWQATKDDLNIYQTMEEEIEISRY